MPLYLYALICVIGLSGPIALISQGSEYTYRDYYHTPEFRGKLGEYVAYLNLFELNSVPVEEAKASLTVEDYEIANYRNRFGPLAYMQNSYNEQYDPLIQEAVAADSPDVASYYREEKENKRLELAKIMEDDEYVASLIRKEKEAGIDASYQDRELYRARFMSLQDQFDYYLKNSTTGIYHTSLRTSNENTARKQLFGDNYLYAVDYMVDTNRLMYLGVAGDGGLSSNLPYKGWVAVAAGSSIQAEAEKYRQEQLILLIYGLAGTALLVFCLFRFGYARSVPSEPRGRSPYLNLPLDVKSLLLAGTAALTIGLPIAAAGRFPTLLDDPWGYAGRLIVTLAVAAAGLSLTLLQARLLATELHNWEDVRTQWRRSLLRSGGARLRASMVRTGNQVRDSFLYRSSGARLLVLTIALFGLGVIAGAATIAIGEDDAFVFLLFVLAGALVALPIVLLSARSVGYLNRIAKAAEELAAGAMTKELPVRGRSVLAVLAGHLNGLRSGVRLLQNEQAKSERLKTELIANVSHDLRTPLTSIITYTGLLRSEETTEEERAAYLEIIDRKSQRLQTMIDDLFEVSKMSSGNVELALDKTDLVQLMQQALAEYKDVIQGLSVQFRIALPEEPVCVLADGQKLWRVFDNLIGNMTKYSLDHSRAYISLHLTERREAAITFKNVSKFEYGEEVAELFERFKRGDASRHTEGAGLGLAIAKSIVDLHEGNLTIETDGDLFKAVVTLKLIPEADAL